MNLFMILSIVCAVIAVVSWVDQSAGQSSQDR